MVPPQQGLVAKPSFRTLRIVPQKSDNQAAANVQSNAGTRPPREMPDTTQRETLPGGLADLRAKNKRQQKQDERKAKEIIAVEVKDGTIVIPRAPQAFDDAEENPPLRDGPHHEECSCMYCKCKLSKDPLGQTLCGGAYGEKCAVCTNVRKMLSRQTDELNEAHNRQINDIMQAQNDYEEGFLEDIIKERAAEIAKKREQKELKERNIVLNGELNLLQKEIKETNQQLPALKKAIAEAKKIREQQEAEERAERKRTGNYYGPA